MERVGVQRLGGVCARLVFVTVLQVRRTGTGRKQQEAGDHRDSYIYLKPEGICLKIFNLTCALIAVSVTSAGFVQLPMGYPQDCGVNGKDT